MRLYLEANRNWNQRTRSDGAPNGFAAALQDASRQLIIQRLGLLYLFSSPSSSSSSESGHLLSICSSHPVLSLPVCHPDLSRWDSNCRLSDRGPALSVNIASLLAPLPLPFPFHPLFRTLPYTYPFISISCLPFLSQIVFLFSFLCPGSPRSASRSLLTCSAQPDSSSVLFKEFIKYVFRKLQGK